MPAGKLAGMDRFTAIVLSAAPVSLVLPGVTVLASVQRITTVAQLYDLRLSVLSRVTTPFCFYLDDDDEMPADYLDVLNECAAHDSETETACVVPAAFGATRSAPTVRWRRSPATLAWHQIVTCAAPRATTCSKPVRCGDAPPCIGFGRAWVAGETGAMTFSKPRQTLRARAGGAC